MKKNSVVISQGGFMAGRQQTKTRAVRRKVIASVGSVNDGTVMYERMVPIVFIEFLGGTGREL
jgi:hypothetical protein